MKSMKKILFLDIDGVLNTKWWYPTFENYQYDKKYSKMGSSICQLANVFATNGLSGVQMEDGQ